MYERRLSALDTAFLCLESAQAPMHLGALAVFGADHAHPADHLVEIVSERVGRLPCLRQRVRPAWLPPGSAVWVDDRVFDLKHHIHTHDLDGGGRPELTAMAGRLMAEPLDLARPLWQLHLITGLHSGGFAVLVKLHHAMADGLRAVELGVGLLDGFGETDGLAQPQPSATRRPFTQRQSAHDAPGVPASEMSTPGVPVPGGSGLSPTMTPAPALAPPLAALLSLAALPSLLSLRSLPALTALPALPFLAALPNLANLPDLPTVRALLDAARTTSQVATNPGRLRAYLHDAVASMAAALPEAIHREGILPDAIHQVADVVGIASSILSNARLGTLASSLVSTLAGAASTGTGDNSSAAGAPTGSRRLAILHLDVGEIRQVRKRHGGTDNDVLLAVITGALRHWLSPFTERGSMRALVPVSRRSRPDEPGRGNVLSGYLCDLPVQEKDPLTRLHTIRATMDRNKASGFGHGPGAIPILADRVPAALHRVTAPLTRHGANLLFDTMVTNVPLPARTMSLGGARLLAVYPIVPLPHGQAFGIALSAYQGRVHVGLHADQQAVPDLDRLAAAVPTALACLTAA